MYLKECGQPSWIQSSTSKAALYKGDQLGQSREGMVVRGHITYLLRATNQRLRTISVSLPTDFTSHH